MSLPINEFAHLKVPLQNIPSTTNNFAQENVNHKSDMYLFGIVLFELPCGRESIIDDKGDNHLAPLAISHYREKKLENMIDHDLLKQMDLHSFNMFAEIVYECLAEERSRRPNIDDIVPRLEKALELARENRP
ncbi:kinase-like domain, phloem protein 2-like protein, partial [Tanacetum coccineum]